MTQTIFGSQSTEQTSTMLNYQNNLRRFHELLLNNKWRNEETAEKQREEAEDKNEEQAILVASE